jgi:6-pyruvoyl-tetrahydropterin synthase
LIELIDERIKRIESVIDQKISDWMDNNVDHDHLINEWMSDNFDVTDYNINDAIHEWSSDNLADEVEKVIKNSLTFSVIVN